MPQSALFDVRIDAAEKVVERTKRVNNLMSILVQTSRISTENALTIIVEPDDIWSEDTEDGDLRKTKENNTVKEETMKESKLTNILEKVIKSQEEESTSPDFVQRTDLRTETNHQGVENKIRFTTIQAAKQYMDDAKNAISLKEYDKAELFIVIANTLDPNENTKDLLKQIQLINSSENGESSCSLDNKKASQIEEANIVTEAKRYMSDALSAIVEKNYDKAELCLLICDKLDPNVETKKLINQLRNFMIPNKYGDTSTLHKNIHRDLQISEIETAEETSADLEHQTTSTQNTTIEANKDEAEKCINLVLDAITKGNILKAERLSIKAERIYPSEFGKELLELIRFNKIHNAETNKKIMQETKSAEYSNKNQGNSQNDADKCIEIAQNAFRNGDFIKAERLLVKVERFWPSEHAKKLLTEVRVAKEASKTKNKEGPSKDSSKNEEKQNNNSTNDTSENKQKAFEQTMIITDNLGYMSYIFSFVTYVTFLAKNLVNSIFKSNENETKSDSSDKKTEENKKYKEKVLINNVTKSAVQTEDAYRRECTKEQLDVIRRVKEAKNDYEIVGVSNRPTSKDIKNAIKKFTLVLHPDKNRALGAAEAFMIAREAAKRLKRNCRT